MTHRAPLTIFAAVALLAGCGGQGGPQDASAPPQTAAEAVVTSSPAARTSTAEQQTGPAEPTERGSSDIEASSAPSASASAGDALPSDWPADVPLPDGCGAIRVDDGEVSCHQTGDSAEAVGAALKTQWEDSGLLILEADDSGDVYTYAALVSDGRVATVKVMEVEPPGTFRVQIAVLAE